MRTVPANETKGPQDENTHPLLRHANHRRHGLRPRHIDGPRRGDLLPTRRAGFPDQRLLGRHAPAHQYVRRRERHGQPAPVAGRRLPVRQGRDRASTQRPASTPRPAAGFPRRLGSCGKPGRHAAHAGAGPDPARDRGGTEMARNLGRGRVVAGCGAPCGFPGGMALGHAGVRGGVRGTAVVLLGRVVDRLRRRRDIPPLGVGRGVRQRGTPLRARRVLLVHRLRVDARHARHPVTELPSQHHLRRRTG